MMINRRIFMRNAAATAIGLAAIPEILSATMPPMESRKKGLISSLNSGDVVLFQGDSITDAGREKVKQTANSPASFGGGYAFLAGAQLLNDLATKDLSIYNRGISGNKVYQLAERWDKDCLCAH